MSAALIPPRTHSPAAGDPGLGRDVLRHLGVQIDSARRLLAAVLRQGAAVRERDVEAVLARLSEMKDEMSLRTGLEEDRGRLLARAGVLLGVPPAAVTLEAMSGLMTPVEAETARGASAELRGLLAEIAREHGINRALMRQELSFLDHLVRVLGQEPESGYRPDGPGAPAGTGAGYRVLDRQA